MNDSARVVRAGLATFLLVSLVSTRSEASCDPGTIEDHVARLGDGDAAVRWEAASSLGACGSGAVGPLSEALASADALVRESAARAVGIVGAAASDAVPHLRLLLADPEPLVRERAAEALGRIGEASAPAVDDLVATFGGDDPYVAGAAAVALSRIGVAAVPALEAALADAKGDVRRSAAIALGRSGAVARPAAGALAAALSDDEAAVRTAAAYALGAIGEEAREAVPALIEALWDRDEEARRAARTALGQIVPRWRKPPSRDEAIATIERLVPSLMEQHHVPGVQVALIDQQNVAWTKSWGVADARTNAPVTDATLFEAASMSKPVFAIVAMQEVDAGRLSLDRPLVRYAPEVTVPALRSREAVTARMALSHTTGMPNWRPGDEEREGPVPVLFWPGTRFGYSGEGIFHLQRVVEAIEGRPLDLLARARLFRPLALEGTTFSWNPAIEPLLASGHGEQGAFLAKSRYRHPNAAYSLYTTAEEYARILVEVMRAEGSTSKLLTQGSAREMLAKQVTLDARTPIERPGAADGRAVHWGLGWSMNQTGAGIYYHHSGANRTGFRCFSQFSTYRRTGIVIMTNGLGGGELWTRLVAAVGDF